MKSLIYKQIDFFYIIMYPIKESLNAGFMMEQEIQERNNFSEAEIQNADKIANKPEITYILLCCCTCKRPSMLQKTLNSINNVKFSDGIKTEVLIVDNDEYASAKGIVDLIKTDFKFKIHYFVEEKRGIAYARNRVLDEAVNLKASHILFFDDDELLNENCLLEHIKLYNENPKAYISSGPTINKFMGEFPNYIKKHLVFKQKYSKETGAEREDCACGNVFFPLSLVKDFNVKFSTEYIFMGGEDGDFFYRASLAGFTIIWNKNAVIEEMVPTERANMNYIMKKCYYNGYSGAIQYIKRMDKNKQLRKKMVYCLKQLIVLFANLLILIPSIILGLSVFFNIMGICLRTKGKIDAVFKSAPIDFYNKIYGS